MLLVHAAANRGPPGGRATGEKRGEGWNKETNIELSEADGRVCGPRPRRLRRGVSNGAINQASARILRSNGTCDPLSLHRGPETSSKEMLAAGLVAILVPVSGADVGWGWAREGEEEEFQWWMARSGTPAGES